MSLRPSPHTLSQGGPFLVTLALCLGSQSHLSPCPLQPRPFLACFFFFFLVLLFYFTSYSFAIALPCFFLADHIVCRILIPRPVVRAELLWRECHAQPPGLTENLTHHGMLIRVKSPGRRHLSTKILPYPTPCKWCWMPQAIQAVR